MKWEDTETPPVLLARQQNYHCRPGKHLGSYQGEPLLAFPAAHPILGLITAELPPGSLKNMGGYSCTGWRPSLENGGYFTLGNMATGGSDEMQRRRKWTDFTSMEEQSHVGRGMETLMGNGGEGNKITGRSSMHRIGHLAPPTSSVWDFKQILVCLDFASLSERWASVASLQIYT